MLRYSRSKTHLCNFCEIKFISIRSLNIHLRYLHKVSPKHENFASEVPRRIEVVQRKPVLISFAKQKTKLEIKEEVVEQAFSKAIIVSEQNKSTAKRSFACNLCNKEFKQKESMMAHRRSTHEGRKFKCEYCTKEFTRKNVLIFHISEKHFYKSKMQCSKCNKTFVSKTGLAYHLRISCEEKAAVDKHFDCDNCEMVLSSK